MITTFDDQWLSGEVLAGAELPPLRAMSPGKEETALAAGQAEQQCCSAVG